MEVTDHLHIIKTNYYGIYTATYLILGDGLTLIDSGERESWEQDIKPYIRSLGRDPEEVRLVVLTHNHDDHVGSARQIRAETGAELVAGEETARFLDRPDSIMRWEEQSFGGWLSDEEKKHILEGTDYNGAPRRRRQPLTVDRQLREGDLIQTGPLVLRVMAAPGHTIDSIALHEPQAKLLFTGDTVFGSGTALDDLNVIQAITEFRETLGTFEALDVGLLLLAHPYLPYADAVLRGDQAKEMIRITLGVPDRISAEIQQVLSNGDGSMTTAEISAEVCIALGPNRPERRSHGTVRLSLVELLRAGAVSAERTNGEVRWTIAK